MASSELDHVRIERVKLRVGIDIASVGETASSIARFGDRYLRRIFTARELVVLTALTEPEATAAAAAARFAAKEAAIKVLRPRGAEIDWHDIEVLRCLRGAPFLRLSGGAAELAKCARIHQLSVSLTHEGTLAAAIVIGVGIG